MNKKIVLAITVGFLLGVTWLVAMRFFTYKSTAVHYHANFALYVNGQQDMFDSFTFYEEVQSCGTDELNNPKARVHLHDSVSTVAHVHDNAATWGHLFANLGYGLTDNGVQTDDGIFVAGESGNNLTFLLNGNEVGSVANRTIGNEDVLLINYGQEDEDTLQQRYEAIRADSAEYNSKTDPSSCSGSQPATFKQRLRDAVGL